MSFVYRDLRDFIDLLEKKRLLHRISRPVSPILEMTEIGDRVLRQGGPALLFQTPQHGNTCYDIPVLANLFGTPERVALGMGAEDLAQLREIGKTLAYLKEPEPPKGLRDAWDKTAITEASAQHGTKRGKKGAMPRHYLGRGGS